MPRAFYRSGFLSLLLFLQACGSVTDSVYSVFLKGIYSGSVQLMSPEELAQRQTQPVLLDTRSEKEYRVSHLQGARLVGYEHFDVAQLQDIPKHTPLVVYCSVGYRSEKVGEKLQEAGYTNVRNLQGGLFGWVNQGRPVYSGLEKTTKVHAYTRTWGVWLQKGEKVYD